MPARTPSPSATPPTTPPGGATAAHRIARRRFHLDHPGAQIGQHHGAIRSRQDARQVDNRDAVQGAGDRHIKIVSLLVWKFRPG